ncbi:DUF1876 domain-containing protein [Streptomyces apocyni]|uniref:DUF1876 domain-containing protein n=1 Tax=Streptomyces apocyni TaxID=2654677 RepID=UPI0012EAE693|nr:DUF1876 domain-containing protein [Streptomyces apocyni]
MPARMWNVQVSIVEEDPLTKAEARLLDGEKELVGNGEARCNPDDENVPDIGDELACARALSDLSHQLVHIAAAEIESHTHKPVQGLRV